MIINIAYETFRQMMGQTNELILYQENDATIELYIQYGASYFKTTYSKQGTEQDLIWKDDNLKKAVRIISIDKKEVNINITQQ